MMKPTPIVFLAIMAISLMMIAIFLGIMTFRRTPPVNVPMSSSSAIPAAAPPMPVTPSPMPPTPTASPGSTQAQSGPTASFQSPDSSVRDYLAFVQGIENRKMALINAQTQAALQNQQRLQSRQLASPLNDNQAMLGDIQRQTDQSIVEWNSLLSSFNTRQPLPLCRDFANKYAAHLASVGDSMAETGRALALAASDPTAALKMLESQKGANKAYDTANEAEAVLDALCRNAGVGKTFNIRLP